MIQKYDHNEICDCPGMVPDELGEWVRREDCGKLRAELLQNKETIQFIKDRYNNDHEGVLGLLNDVCVFRGKIRDLEADLAAVREELEKIKEEVFMAYNDPHSCLEIMRRIIENHNCDLRPCGGCNQLTMWLTTEKQNHESTKTELADVREELKKTAEERDELNEALKMDQEFIDELKSYPGTCWSCAKHEREWRNPGGDPHGIIDDYCSEESFETNGDPRMIEFPSVFKMCPKWERRIAGEGEK